VFGGPTSPRWSVDAFLWLTHLGRYVNAFVNELRMRTTYESMADFMADDLTLGRDKGLV
jgi:hypothetical protein